MSLALDIAARAGRAEARVEMAQQTLELIAGLLDAFDDCAFIRDIAQDQADDLTRYLTTVASNCSGCDGPAAC